MTTARRTLHIALVALTLAAAAQGAMRGTQAEARAMREKAVEHFGSAGRAAVLVVSPDEVVSAQLAEDAQYG